VDNKAIRARRMDIIRTPLSD